MDSKNDKQGDLFLGMCKSSGLIIVNGNHSPKKIHRIYKESCYDDTVIISVFHHFHNKKYKKKSPSYPWINKKCIVNHREVFRAKHIYRRINSDCNRKKLTQRSIAYKKVIKSKERV